MGALPLVVRYTFFFVGWSSASFISCCESVYKKCLLGSECKTYLLLVSSQHLTCKALIFAGLLRLIGAEFSKERVIRLLLSFNFVQIWPTLSLLPQQGLIIELLTPLERVRDSLEVYLLFAVLPERLVQESNSVHCVSGRL